MKLGLVTYNVGRDWDIETIIRQLEAARFEAVELRSTHRHGVEPGLPQAEVERVRSRFQNSRVRLLSLGSACEFHSPDEAERRATWSRPPASSNSRTTWAAGASRCARTGCRRESPRRHHPPDRRGAAGMWRARAALRDRDLGRSPRPPDPATRSHAADHGRLRPPVGRDLLELKPDRHSQRDHQAVLRPAQGLHPQRPYRDLPDYPHRELFRLLASIDYDRYTLAETAQSCEPERYLRFYRALWQELVSDGRA